MVPAPAMQPLRTTPTRRLASRSTPVLLAVLCAISTAGACGSRSERAPKTAPEGAPSALPAPLPARVVPRRENLGRGLEVEVLADGAGPTLAQGGRARIHYRGKVVGAETYFDGTHRSGLPMAVELGRTPLLYGLRLALEGRAQGAHLVVHIPAALAFGEREDGPVPAGSDLVYEVRVVSIP